MKLTWPRRSTFRDAVRDIHVQGPDGVIDTDDLDDGAVEDLLDRGFEPADDDADPSSPADADDPDDVRRFKDAFVDGDADADDAVESGTLPWNPDDQTVDDIRERLDDIDDPATVRALRSVEQDQKSRNTAVEAFDSRLSDLTDDAGD